MQDNESSHCTSNQFGDRMGEGWKAGLLHLQLGFRMLLNWKVFDVSGNTIGDIDSAVTFENDQLVTSIFPVMAKFSNSSKRIRSLTSRHFFVEFKRSRHENAMDKHINQFVSFYKVLLDPAKRDEIQRRKFPNFLKKALDSQDLVLLFVFNGADNVKVERCLRNKLDNVLKIHGHDVVTAWCPSEELIKWDDMQEKARLEANEARLKANEARLEANEARLKANEALLKAEIERLRRELYNEKHPKKK